MLLQVLRARPDALHLLLSILWFPATLGSEGWVFIKNNTVDWASTIFYITC
jgi:hypothetical protein